MRFLVLVVAAVLLAGCQSLRYEGDENSPYYRLPTGSRVQLKQTLAISPEKVGVYIQNGKIMSWSEIDHYHAYCKFEVRKRKDTEQQVLPDEFVVTRVVQDVVHSVRWGEWQVAETLLGMRVSDKSGGPSLWTYATYMYVASDRQPHVFRLGCGHSAYPGSREAVHLSINQIRRALGDVIVLRLPVKGTTSAPATVSQGKDHQTDSACNAGGMSSTFACRYHASNAAHSGSFSRGAQDAKCLSVRGA